MINHERRQISYAEAARYVDERTLVALTTIGSPALELDERGKVAIKGGMSQEMMQTYGVAYLGDRNGPLWARMGYPLEADSSDSNARQEIARPILNTGDFLEESTKRSLNRSLMQLTFVITVVLVLWFSGFNALITGWIDAYVGTWVISPIAGMVLSAAIYGLYKFLEFIRRVF